jgi:MinD superfamily P-loop ATPase
MMNDRVEAKPEQNEEKCLECGECAINCPPQALILDPEFHISDACIACFCCVELCPEGALTVPDIEAFRHY